MYPELGVGVTPDISAKFADAAIGMIEHRSDKPWFCHVNFTAPHDPLFISPGMEGKYSVEGIPLPGNFLPVHPLDHGNFDGRDEALLAWPRAKEAVRDLLRVYYSVIEDMDAQIGRILEALDASGQLENTIIIFTSDHGLACGSHGLRGKQNMYEHTINVPFVMAGPSVPAGEQTNAQIYLRELYPTTCELANVTIPESVTAESFAPVIRDPGAAHQKEIFGYFKDTQRMVRTENGWKLVHYPAIGEWQLFDLNSDPLETKNLADSDAASSTLSELRGMLETWREELGDPALEP
ncbi:MAG: sulfatase-like hydrolase/transferase [Verrucomicrobiales bacterium]|nr:sulfatase-like hydrolase/transferase [Verrucomicrobiales bacterium]